MKTTLNLRIDNRLKDFLKRFAKENHTTVTGLITQYAFYLQKRYQKHEKDVQPLSVQHIPDDQAETEI
jgi:hypothetical protein